MARILLIALIALVIFTVVQPYLPAQKTAVKIFDYKAGMDTSGMVQDYKYVEDMPLRNMAPCREFWFGTNAVGQDLWARVWAGTRTSLLMALIVAVFNCIVGITLGVLWGYVRKLDALLTEVYNIIDNIPRTIILILISYILRPGMTTIIFALSITGWIGMARFVRNQVLIIRDRDYNVASRTLGASTWRIMTRNLLPYLVSVIMLRMALSIPGAIGSEVFITYIGLGLPIEVCSLGNLINEGRKLMMSPNLRYQLIYPTIILSIVTVSFYIIGNAFSDAADPRNHL
jgi:oligopeptide transport system permease protein